MRSYRYHRYHTTMGRPVLNQHFDVRLWNEETQHLYLALFAFGYRNLFHAQVMLAVEPQSRHGRHCVGFVIAIPSEIRYVEEYVSRDPVQVRD